MYYWLYIVSRGFVFGNHLSQKARQLSGSKEGGTKEETKESKEKESKEKESKEKER